MFLSDANQIILEQFTPPSDSFDQQPDDETNTEDVVEFENIKLFILYNKCVSLKNKIRIYSTLENDKSRLEQLIQMYNMLEIVQLYFNTLTYNQLVSMINTITDQVLTMYNHLLESK